MMKTLPSIPTSSPFTEAQRLWLNGYIAGLISEADDSPAVSSKPKLRVAVMYASQSGNSEALAESFAEQLSEAGFDSPCFSTEDYSEIDLTSEKRLILVSSTWGEGDPPDNAIDFWNALQSDEHPRLENLSYGVLALGDTNYLDFCAQGKAFDKRLGELGAKRFIDRADCDTDFEEVAEAWFESVRGILAKEQGDDAPTPAEKGGNSTPDEPKWSKKNPFPARLLMNRRLNSENSARDTRHFEIELTGSGLSYEVGDVLGLYGHNHPQAVDELTALLAFDGDSTVTLTDGESMSLRTALIERFDIRTVNRPLLEAWARITESESLRQLLADESDASAVENYLWGREIIDLIAEHRPRFADPSDFLALLRKLGPRLYSISSSPKAHPDEVHLTVARVGYEAHGRRRFGVCSTYLSDRVYPEGEVKVFLQEAKHFKLPGNLDTPVIMVGPGTGIAPFRAFLEERKATEAPGLNWLFFGNPHEADDFLYREQLEELQNEGVLTRLDTAWSRDQEEKIYVQQRMIEAGAELWKWLEEGAHFYVCGDAKRMAKDVDDALHSIVAQHGGKTETEAASYLSAMKKEKRYQRDVY
ncbi:assimilatory sulfite reductase (NADPH) flavoprotein subunit [Verrucomicrobiales bacterium BCK34]|nr:assimilatory sulfite reductase (NADPH) flavoprotein subunit [Verrucomicrobiales bacterium BCK34]